MKKRQVTIFRNLRIALDERHSLEEIREMARESFVRTVANLLCSSASEGATRAQIGDMMRIENPEVLHAAVKKGKGVVILLGHMGNWELLTQIRDFFPDGTKLGAFYRPLNNPILNERVLKQRESDGTKLFSKRDSLHHVAGFLRENGVIGILSDQRAGLQGQVAPYFGRLTRVSPLPSLLVRRCKSEVVAFSMRTEEPGKWVVRCHSVERPANPINCTKAVETAMRVSVMDVFWLQERWKVYLSPKSTPSGWLGGDDTRSEKPHRAIVWREREEADCALPDGSLHNDIRYDHVTGQDPSVLRELDEQEQLPIDFILCFSDHPRLQKQAAELGIPVYPVSRYSK